MNKTRNDTFDKISGILILWMIIYHGLRRGQLIDTYIYNVLLKMFFFFIPWFFFKTGMFLKENQIFRKIFLKGIEQLIIPMIFWMLIGYFFLKLSDLFNNNFSFWKTLVSPIYHLLKSGDIVGNSPLWFLLSLFLVKIMMLFVLKLRTRRIYLLCFGFIILGFLLSEQNIILPLGLHNLPPALFFTCSGFLYSKLDVKNKIKRPIIFLVLIFIYGLIFFYYPSYVDFHVNSVIFGNYGVYIFNSLIGISLSLIIFEKIKFRPLSWIGKKSMIFLILHYPIFYLVSLFEISNKYLFSFMLITMAISVSVLVAKFIPEKFIGLDIKIK